MFTTPEHTDSSMLTMLSTFEYPGLQVLVGDNYRSIRPMKNSLVVNLGGIMEEIT